MHGTAGVNGEPHPCSRGHVMKHIRTKKKVVAWLYDQLIASKPRIEVSKDIVEFGRGLAKDVLDSGYVIPFAPPEWFAIVSELCTATTSSPIRCGRPLITFIAGFHEDVSEAADTG